MTPEFKNIAAMALILIILGDSRRSRKNDLVKPMPVVKVYHQFWPDTDLCWHKQSSRRLWLHSTVFWEYLELEKWSTWGHKVLPSVIICHVLKSFKVNFYNLGVQKMWLAGHKFTGNIGSAYNSSTVQQCSNVAALLHSWSQWKAAQKGWTHLLFVCYTIPHVRRALCTQT